MKLPEYLYHGTYSTLVEHILVNGLIRVPRDWRLWTTEASPDCVYLCYFDDDAYAWAAAGMGRMLKMSDHDEYVINNVSPVVLRIDTAGLDSSLLWLDSGYKAEYCYAGDIDPMWIEVLFEST